MTGIAYLYNHTNFLNTGVAVLSGIIISDTCICLAYLSQILANYLTLTYLNFN